MSPIVVNLEGVKTSLEAIPDGTYDARFVKRTFGMSKEQKPKVELEYVFNEDQGEGVAGRKAFVTCSLQPQALFKLKRTAIHMGAEPDDLETQVDLEALFDSLIGSECRIKVGHHIYNDSVHNDFDVAAPDSWSDQ
jgi:hypothetical protein